MISINRQNFCRTIPLISMLFSFLFGCTNEDKSDLIFTQTNTLLITTQASTLTLLPTVSSTPTSKVFSNLVFYGDSSLAIGEAGDGIDHVGYSFVTYLDELIGESQNFIMENYGGRTAKWAYEHLGEKITPHEPDILTLWWGFDDLGGCPGSFDRETNLQVDYKINTIVNEHIKYLGWIIDESVKQGTSVFVLTPLPILQGKLLWNHLDEDFNIVWEEGRWCDFILSEEILVQAQKDLVFQYSSAGKPVYLIDVWQIYHDNLGAEKMYMDVVHPGSFGAQLIAKEWARQYQELLR